MFDAILEMPVIDGPLLWILGVLSVAGIVALLLRRPSLRWLLTAAIGVLGGVFVALIAIWIVAGAMNAFGGPLPTQAVVIIAATFAAVGLAIVSLWGSARWRKVVAIAGIVIFALTGVFGVNAYYGLDRTLGSMFGITAEHPIPLPTPAPTNGTATPDPGVALYKTWTPPAGMPAKGQRGTQQIPGTLSSFPARPAGIYLPPAALVQNPPALPLMIMMMGQPGNPDIDPTADVMDAYAAQHDGLAPIVIVADQLAVQTNDTVCMDSTVEGNAETYVTKDVVNWARANLNVYQDPAHWLIAGYSNGGACAFKFGAEYPEVFGNVLSVSGELYAGSDNVQQTVDVLFGGDQAAFEATWPANIIGSGAHKYPDTTAVFTSGANDPTYQKEASQAAAAAEAGGWNVTNDVIPGVDHSFAALDAGLRDGMDVFYPRLGLAAPGS